MIWIIALMALILIGFGLAYLEREGVIPKSKECAFWYGLKNSRLRTGSTNWGRRL